MARKIMCPVSPFSMVDLEWIETKMGFSMGEWTDRVLVNLARNP